MLVIHGDHGHSGMASAAMCTIAQRSQSWATCDAPLTTGATGQRPGPSDKIANVYSVQNNQQAQEKEKMRSVHSFRYQTLRFLPSPLYKNQRVRTLRKEIDLFRSALRKAGDLLVSN